MLKITSIVLIAALALGACSPVVRDQDLLDNLAKSGYSKVLLRDKINCGAFGQGRHFIGQQKSGSKVLGQICFKKQGSETSYNVAVNHVIVAVPPKNPEDYKVPNPWKK